MSKSTFFMKAAVAGLVGAAALASVPAHAQDSGAEKGKCVGANACKGKGHALNDCAGKNGCKGKGYVEKTKAECDALAKKNKMIHFETAGNM